MRMPQQDTLYVLRFCDSPIRSDDRVCRSFSLYFTLSVAAETHDIRTIPESIRFGSSSGAVYIGGGSELQCTNTLRDWTTYITHAFWHQHQGTSQHLLSTLFLTTLSLSDTVQHLLLKRLEHTVNGWGSDQTYTQSKVHIAHRINTNRDIPNAKSVIKIPFTGRSVSNHQYTRNWEGYIAWGHNSMVQLMSQKT